MSWPMIAALILGTLKGVLSFAVSHWQLLAAVALGVACIWGTDWHVRGVAYGLTLVLFGVYALDRGSKLL